MYWQLNFSTFKKDKPECVLIRALEPKEGIDLMIKNRKLKKPKNPTSKVRYSDRSVGAIDERFLKKLCFGPGVLCQALNLDKSFYGYDICQKKAIFFVEDRGMKIKASQIARGPRIGIDYAGPYWSKIPWRFWLKK